MLIGSVGMYLNGWDYIAIYDNRRRSVANPLLNRDLLLGRQIQLQAVIEASQ